MMTPFVSQTIQLQQLLLPSQTKTLPGTQVLFRSNVSRGRMKPLSLTIVDLKSYRQGMRRLSVFVLPIPLAHCAVDAFLESCSTLVQMFR